MGANYAFSGEIPLSENTKYWLVLDAVQGSNEDLFGVAFNWVAVAEPTNGFEYEGEANVFAAASTAFTDGEGPLGSGLWVERDANPYVALFAAEEENEGGDLPSVPPAGEAIPEPTTLLGLSIAGMGSVLARRKLRRREAEV